jgi:hypothetical protein
MDRDAVLADVTLEGSERATDGAFGFGIEWQPADGPTGRRAAKLDVTNIGERFIDAGLIVSVAVPGATTPEWLIPGLFYGENRPVECTRRYPRYAPQPVDGDPFTADSWTFRVDRAASPAVMGWSEAGGIALETAELGPLGLNGLGLGDAAGGHEVRLAFPYREEPVAYDGSETPGAADKPTHRWEAGASVGLPFAVHDVRGGWDGAFAVVRDVHARLAATGALNPWVGSEAAADLAAAGLRDWHYREVPGAGPDGGPGAVLYETIAFERPVDRTDAPGDRAAMHVAWLSGIPAAAGLLRHGRRRGNQRLTDAAAAVIDTIVANPAPCGTLWGQWSAERGWGKGWTPGPDALHARTLGEAVTFLLRAVEDERARASDDRAGWLTAAARNLRFIVERQRDDGAIPAAWNGRTGEPLSWTGSAGLAWVPPLLHGSRLLDDLALAEAARRAGAFYASFVERGFLHGAPEDVDLAPSSEDGYLAIMAYVALLETARDAGERERWLALANRSADWTHTFRYAWNVAFEPETLLGRYDVRTRGADQASPANQHLHAYGLVCLAETVRLARHAADEQHLVRAREHFACYRQLIARVDGDFNAMRGMAPERCYQTACFGPKGGIGALSHAWVLGLLLNACEDAATLPELVDDR